MSFSELELSDVTYITPIEIFKVPEGAGWVLKVSASHKTKFYTPLFEVTDLSEEDFPYEEFFEQMLDATEGEIRALCGSLFNVGFEHDWKLRYIPRPTVNGSMLYADCTLRVETCLASDWKSPYLVRIAKRIKGWEYHLQLSYYSGTPPDKE